MKIDGSVLDLVGMRFFNAPYTGGDANLTELKRDIIDLIKRSWKFYNDFLNSEDANDLTNLELYGASQIATNSSDVDINLFYRNSVSISDLLYTLYFNVFLNKVDMWSVFPDDLDFFKESIDGFEDKYGEDLTKICLLVGIYFESLDTRYLHIREYAYERFLHDEKELEEFRKSSHYGFVTNHPSKIDLSTTDSYENMTVDELIDEFGKFATENRKMRDAIFENK